MLRKKGKIETSDQYRLQRLFLIGAYHPKKCQHSRNRYYSTLQKNYSEMKVASVNSWPSSEISSSPIFSLRVTLGAY